jgi:hypothetical protein
MISTQFRLLNNRGSHYDPFNPIFLNFTIIQKFTNLEHTNWLLNYTTSYNTTPFTTPHLPKFIVKISLNHMQHKLYKKAMHNWNSLFLPPLSSVSCYLSNLKQSMKFLISILIVSEEISPNSTLQVLGCISLTLIF